jgi:hypothetical protein
MEGDVKANCRAFRVVCACAGLSLFRVVVYMSLSINSREHMFV